MLADGLLFSRAVRVHPGSPVLKFRRVVPLLAVLLAACSGGGGGGGGGTTNQPPTASFTATPLSGQAPLTVAFDASASSDPDGSIAGYAWNFGDGGSGTGTSTSRTFAAAGSFTVRLTVTDNLGATASSTRIVTVTAGPPPPAVTISGRISFDRVPFSVAAERGLSYPRTFEAPAREVEVELLRASSSEVLATTSTDAAGNFSLTGPGGTDVFLRAKALSRFVGTAARPASWDLRVLNNTNGNALYVLDGTVFNSGSADQTRNLRAATGWGGDFAGVYTGVRASAPFAVLDTLYSAVQLVIAQGDPAAQLVPLEAFWSPNNRPSATFAPAAGDIETTQYITPGSGFPKGIYVLGAASNDTDEFDQHVIAHEFHHYLEDAVSRADSMGGTHSLDERLDPRVAFSEGFANAFSAMVLQDPAYRDSFGVAQGSDFGFDLENGVSSVPGWYNEASIHGIVWDLYDAANEPGDTVTLGFGPIYDVLRSELRDGVPLVSLFPFIAAIKQRPGVPAAAVDARVEAERLAGTSLGIVSTTMDAYATTETHSGVAPLSADLVLPVYTPIALNGPAVRVCASSELTVPGGAIVPGTFNKLGNRRLLRFSVPGGRTLRIRVTCPATDATCAGLPQPDPDFVLSRASEFTVAESETPRVEELDVPATAGDYVLEIYDYSHVDPSAGRRERTCITVTITG
jgi:PKD repeat protein